MDSAEVADRVLVTRFLVHLDSLILRRIILRQRNHDECHGLIRSDQYTIFLWEEDQMSPIIGSRIVHTCYVVPLVGMSSSTSNVREMIEALVLR